MGNKISLEDEMINLKLAAKQMNRSSRKCEKNEKAAIEKLKKVGIQALFFKHDLISYLRSRLCMFPILGTSFCCHYFPPFHAPL